MKKYVFLILAGIAAIAANAITASEAYVDKQDAKVATAATNYTDAAIAAIPASADGAACPLPKYLHALEYDATYPEDVAALRGALAGRFGCSARRSGGILERNYDLHLDETAEFAIRMSGNDTRFASLGVANVGTNLTEQFVTSGKSSRWYKVLPSIMLDGINENGVVCEVNVTDGEWGRTSGEIHCLEAVRWALDNGTSAGMVASNLAAKVYIPQGFGNFHWMVADAAETWIVENCAARKVTDAVAVMTNFSEGSAGGEGHERYASLTNGATITSQWWTAAYDRNTRPIRVSDIGADYEDVWAAWESATKEEHRAQEGWWQTLHTSIYDITNRVLRVAVQETDDWYVFALAKKVVETDPTVPAWAKQATPPEGMAANALVWTNNVVKTKDGVKTIGAEDVGAITADGNQTVLGRYTIKDYNGSSISTTIPISIVGYTTSQSGQQINDGYKTTLESSSVSVGKTYTGGNNEFCVIQPWSIMVGSNSVDGDETYVEYVKDGVLVSSGTVRPDYKLLFPRHSGTFATTDDIPAAPGNYAAVSNAAMNAVANDADYASVKAKALNSAQYHEYGYPFLGRQDLMVKNAMVVGTTNYTQRANHTEYCDGSIQNEAMDCYLYLPYGKSGNIAVEDPFEMSRLLAMAETNETAKADICEKLCDIGVNDIKDETSNVVYRLEADGTRFYFRPIRPINMED